MYKRIKLAVLAKTIGALIKLVRHVHNEMLNKQLKDVNVRRGQIVALKRENHIRYLFGLPKRVPRWLEDLLKRDELLQSLEEWLEKADLALWRYELVKES